MDCQNKSTMRVGGRIKRVGGGLAHSCWEREVAEDYFERMFVWGQRLDRTDTVWAFCVTRGKLPRQGLACLACALHASRYGDDDELAISFSSMKPEIDCLAICAGYYGICSLELWCSAKLITNGLNQQSPGLLGTVGVITGVYGKQ